MFAIIGIFVVLGGVVGGYLLEGGNLHVLWQPAELVIIGGAAMGALIIASPKKVLILTIKHFVHVFTGKEATKAQYMDLLALLYELLSFARREGVVALESHVNKPESSSMFGKHPLVAKNHEAMEFICDNFKVYIAGNVEPHQFESLMDLDMETHHSLEAVPAASINRVADSLPGMGIVAAVLGVVLTMGKISEPPEVLGHSIGAALVGTFLGILMCYGFLGPMAANLEHLSRDKHNLLNSIKAALMAFSQGWPPIMAVESARRAIPHDSRPGFNELEEHLRNVK